MAGIRGKVWLYRSGLALFGAIDTGWRTGIEVFGLCDAAKWGQCRRVVPMPPSGANASGGVLMPPSGGNACGSLLGDEAVAGLALWGAAAPTQPPRNMDTFCRPAAPAQQWQHDKSETRSNPR